MLKCLYEEVIGDVKQVDDIWLKVGNFVRGYKNQNR